MSFNEFFKECYYIGSLSEGEQKEYYLISKYKSKVSRRLINRQKELYEKGKIEFSVTLKLMITGPNPFLRMIPKDFSTKSYYPTIPLPNIKN
jgi:hypothetical protein